MYNYITENKFSYFSESLKYLNKSSTAGWKIKYTSTLLIWEIICYRSRLVLIRFSNYKRKKNLIKLQKDRTFIEKGLHVSSSFRKQTSNVALRLQTRAEDTTMRALCNNYLPSAYVTGRLGSRRRGSSVGFQMLSREERVRVSCSRFFSQQNKTLFNSERQQCGLVDSSWKSCSELMNRSLINA